MNLIYKLFDKITLPFAILCIIFMQKGITYYISFQTAILIIFYLKIIESEYYIRNKEILSNIILLFIIFTLYKLCYHPDIISQNSNNIILSYFGLIIYAVTLLLLSSLELRNIEIIILYKKISIYAILLLLTLFYISDLGIIRDFNAEYMLYDNQYLITNFNSYDSIHQYIKYKKSVGEKLDNDLFYGEASFLSLVILILATSLFYIKSNIDNSKINLLDRILILLIISFFFSVRSLSSFIYLVIFVIYIITRYGLNDLISVANRHFLVMLLLLLLIMFIYYSSNIEYIYLRFSGLSKSGSLYDRFIVFGEYKFVDYFFGLNMSDQIPKHGFHNGLLYILMISGFAGVIYISYILYAIVERNSITQGLILSLIFLFIIMQNGGVFSPNKVVLASFIFVPIAFNSRRILGSR